MWSSLPAPPAYLYGLLNVDTGVSDGAEQVVEAAHLLHQHCVHALIVAGGEAPHHCLQVEVCRQLAQDVSCHIKDHVIWGFGVSAWRAGLIRDTERQRMDEKRRQDLWLSSVWQFIVFWGRNYLSLSFDLSNYAFPFKESFALALIWSPKDPDFKRLWLLTYLCLYFTVFAPYCFRYMLRNDREYQSCDWNLDFIFPF